MSATEPVEQAERGESAEPFRVGDRLPLLLSPAELMRALNMSEGAFNHHRLAGRFDRFLVKRPIGLKRYSGKLVQIHVDSGERDRG